MTRIRVFAALSVAVLLSVLATGAVAQSVPGVGVEVRGGGAMGSYEPAAAPRHWGQQPALAATVSYRVRPSLSVYGGYSRASFGCRGGFCEGAEIDYLSRGWDAGLQLGDGAGLWIRAGGSVHSLDVPASPTGSPRLDSERAFGPHVAAGYAFVLRPRIRLSPGVRYSRYEARFPGNPTGDRVDYLVVDLGVGFTF